MEYTSRACHQLLIKSGGITLLLIICQSMSTWTASRTIVNHFISATNLCNGNQILPLKGALFRYVVAFIVTQERTKIRFVTEMTWTCVLFHFWTAWYWSTTSLLMVVTAYSGIQHTDSLKLHFPNTLPSSISYLYCNKLLVSCSSLHKPSPN